MPYYGFRINDTPGNCDPFDVTAMRAMFVAKTKGKSKGGRISANRPPRDVLKGMNPYTHRSKVPLQVFSRETTPVRNIGSQTLIDGLLSQKRKPLLYPSFMLLNQKSVFAMMPFRL